MAVLPDHQRRGLGDAILTTLLGQSGSRPRPARTSTCSRPHRAGASTRGTASGDAPNSIGLALRLT
jgi:hypothetical protein